MPILTGENTSKKPLSSQSLWVNQTSRIYRFEATASCCILCNAVVENKVTLGSDHEPHNAGMQDTGGNFFVAVHL
jgi:hypothetical protein